MASRGVPLLAFLSVSIRHDQGYNGITVENDHRLVTAEIAVSIASLCTVVGKLELECWEKYEVDMI